MENRWKEKFIASVVALHGRQLLRFFISRLPDAGEAKDLSQEVYLRLLRLDRPDLIRCPEAYLFTIAANIAREHLLKRSSRPLHIALEDAPSEELAADTDTFALPTAEDVADLEDRIQQLEAALAGLSPKARAALIWHRRDGRTYKEIGARLGVSRSMVKKYLAQALAQCRQNMDVGHGS